MAKKHQELTSDHLPHPLVHWGYDANLQPKINFIRSKQGTIIRAEFHTVCGAPWKWMAEQPNEVTCSECFASPEYTAAVESKQVFGSISKLAFQTGYTVGRSQRKHLHAEPNN